jgi:outer membrane protein assembly factor BamB
MLRLSARGVVMYRRSLAIACVITSFAFIAAGCDWPMFAYGPAHTGYNPFERTIGVANVGALHESWTARLGDPLGGSAPPVVVNGIVYATSGAGPFRLEAFDAGGVKGCSGTPKTCAPRWTASTGGAVDSLNVSNGVVYVGTHAGTLAAFDAAGVNGCAGTPTTCNPLWQATAVSGDSIAVAGKWVYAPTIDGHVKAFDAAGVNGCSGTPKQCAPQWSVIGSNPAVANGLLYTSGVSAGAFEVRAYDAAGIDRCTGTPKTCMPYWTGREGGIDIINDVSAPTVARGYVWIGVAIGDETITSGRLFGFDAAGVRNCAGTPKVCTATWRAPTDAVDFPPAVVGNTLVTTSRFFSSDGLSSVRRARLVAFDIKACANVRTMCSPLWTANVDPLPNGYGIANGVVYLSTWNDHRVAAFDVAGVAGCSGPLTTCTSVWSTVSSGAPTPPVIANGNVYFGTDADNVLHAFNRR